MLSDRELEQLCQPIIKIFDEIEIELLVEIAQRFDNYEKIGGSLEWQLKKLGELGVLNARAVKVISKFSKRTEEELYNMLKQASLANIDAKELNQAYSKGLSLMTYKKLLKNKRLSKVIREAYDEARKIINLVKTKCLESTRQGYVNIVNKAYLETTMGIRSYNEAVWKACEELAKQGITGATYKRVDKNGNEKIVNYQLDTVIKRNILSTANKTAIDGTIQSAKEIGTNYVETSQHLGARIGDGGANYTNHGWWQGKVYQIDGSSAEYPNLAETTGLGDIRGLGGINCRHRVFPFFPGFSKPKEHIDEKENARVYKLEQKQRAMERKLKALRRQYAMAEQLGEKEQKKRLWALIEAQDKELQRFCDSNGLKRDGSREAIR